MTHTYFSTDSRHETAEIPASQHWGTAAGRPAPWANQFSPQALIVEPSPLRASFPVAAAGSATTPSSHYLTPALPPLPSPDTLAPLEEPTSSEFWLTTIRGAELLSTIEQRLRAIDSVFDD